MSRLSLESELAEEKLGYTSRPTFTSLCHEVQLRESLGHEESENFFSIINRLGSVMPGQRQVDLVLQSSAISFWPTSSTLVGTDGLESRAITPTPRVFKVPDLAHTCIHLSYSIP